MDIDNYQGFDSTGYDVGIGVTSLLSNIPFIGGFFGDSKSVIEQNKRMAFQEYMMDKGNAFNEYMYDKNNAYNSPEEQKKRLIAAGVNPEAAARSVAGIQTAVAPSSSSAPSAPELNPQLALLDAQRKKTEAETEKVEAETQDIPRINQANIDKALAEAAAAVEQGKLTKLEREQQEQLFETLKGIKENELENIKKLVLITEQQLETAKAQKRSAMAQAAIDELRGKLASYGIDYQANPWQVVIGSLVNGKPVKWLESGIDTLLETFDLPTIDEQENILLERAKHKRFVGHDDSVGSDSPKVLNKSIMSSDQRQEFQSTLDHYLDIWRSPGFDKSKNAWLAGEIRNLSAILYGDPYHVKL